MDGKASAVMAACPSWTYGSGSIPEVGDHDFDVCFAPESGSRETPVALPLCARSGN